MVIGWLKSRLRISFAVTFVLPAMTPDDVDRSIFADSAEEILSADFSDAADDLEDSAVVSAEVWGFSSEALPHAVIVVMATAAVRNIAVLFLNKLVLIITTSYLPLFYCRLKAGMILLLNVVLCATDIIM